MKHTAPNTTVTPTIVEQAKRHRLFDKKILSILFIVLLFTAIAVVLGVATFFMTDDENTRGTIASIVGSIALLLWYQFYFRKELDSVVGWSTRGLLLVAPGLLFVVSNFIDAFRHQGALTPVLTALFIAAAPGISEEIVFRAIPLSNWMRVSHTKRDILTSILATGLVFGFFHGFNGLIGADPASTVFQVFYASCLGIFLGAVFLRCGSILPCILLHTFVDFTAFLSMDTSSGGLVTDTLVFDASFFAAAIASIVLVVVGLYLIRPSKQDEIVVLWDKAIH